MIQRLRRSAGVVVATVALAGAGLAAAGPALAFDGLCGDSTNAQPTAVHSAPSDTSSTIEFKNSGSWVTGTCVYFTHQDPDGAHWYMTVNLGGGGYGYIWVQRLAFGSYHLCDDNGTTYPIEGGSQHCPLTPG